MITRDIRAFVDRDWALARRAKDEYWGERIARLGAAEGLRIADELRRQALARDPNWPSAAERDAWAQFEGHSWQHMFPGFGTDEQRAAYLPAAIAGETIGAYAITEPKLESMNYLVEGARIGQTTDYDKLTLEVWTNGSVTPRDAVSLSAKLVRDHLNIFVNLEDGDDEAIDSGSEPARVGVSNEHLEKIVEELELSVRSYNCLKNANIRTIRELVGKTEAEMLKTKNFGRKSLNEIKEVLATMGLHLGIEVPNWPPDNIEELAKRFEDQY